MSIQNLSYLGLPHCLQIGNGELEVVVSTDVGPRILRVGFPGQPNMLGEYPNRTTASPLGKWKPYGGHRLWAAPENMRTTYAPDNTPIEYSMENELVVHLRQPVDAAGLRKQMTVRMAEQGTEVAIEHAITNCNGWTIQIAPWAVTIVTDGIAILPREPFRSHDVCLTPAQPMTLWYFTDLQDPRLRIGDRYLLARPDASRPAPQKIGLCNKRGWCAYHREQTLLVQRFAYEEAAIYPDCGSNNEVFVAGDYMEVELLGPLRSLAENETVRMNHRWQLIPNVLLQDDEESIHDAIAPCIAMDGL